MDLISDMHESHVRSNNVKSLWKKEAVTTRPEFRNKAQTFEYYKRMGYNQDPAIENIPKIENLSFEELLAFYNENIKDQPIAIGIMGNPKIINQEELKKFGKVVRLNEKRLFNTKDTMF